MREVRSVADMAFEAEKSHEFGVVYAVRFDEADINLLRYSGSMGLYAKGVIPASRIVARMEIPRSFNEKFHSRQGTGWLEKLSSGLIGRL